MAKKRKKHKKSGFNRKSTAEQVTEGVDLTGKTVFVTGVNSGLGLESARVLAMRGAHVIGAARTLEKAREGCAQIEGESTPVACELSDWESIAACTDQVKKMGKPIDILLCNAGIMALPELERANGLELQFETNHIGHFLLTLRLLDLVKKAPAGRIVILSSTAHLRAPKEGIQFDNLAGDDTYSGWSAYGQSKLANSMFARELQRRLSGTKVTANSCHPGVIQTNLSRHMLSNGIAAFFMGLLFAPFFRSIPQGAATQCYLSANPNVEGVSGYYFADCNVKKPNKHVEDAKMAKRLWEVSEEIVKDYL